VASPDPLDGSAYRGRVPSGARIAHTAALRALGPPARPRHYARDPVGRSVPSPALAAQRSTEGRRGMKELVVALRWVALGLSLAGAGLGRVQRDEVAAGGVLAIVATLRTVWPLQSGVRSGSVERRGWRWAQGAGVLGELAVCAAIVAATGGAGSPFVLSLAAASFVGGVCLPPVVLSVPAVVAIAGLAAAGASGVVARPVASRYVEGAAMLGTFAMLGSYSEWMVKRGRLSRDEEVERLRNLGELNHLLLELHAKAVLSPGALSLKSSVANVASRLRQLLDPDVIVLMLSDPAATGERWEVTLAEGVGLPDVVSRGALAPALREAASSLGPVCRSELDYAEGVAEEAWTGLYVPLWARESLVGLLAVERVEPGAPFGGAELEMVEGLSRHAGLAIDNARWFRRLRALGAEEERGRIARELHDRVGQSLAYLALCLERMAGEAGASRAPISRQLSAELASLATEARNAVREVRTRLSDLRAEVSEDHGLAAVVEGLVKRAEERSGMAATLALGPLAPLSPSVGREVARIAEEALNNAERHSGGRLVEVRLVWDGRNGELVVADDGKGMPASAPLRPDAFGLLGMRERAEAIGGCLSIGSPGGRGTTVTLRWGEQSSCG
jgi:signal transduction histidine kinase